MLSNQKIEILENKYLEKYYHFLMFAKDELLLGLKSKDKIQDSWLPVWNKSSDQEQKQSFSIGAERIFYSYLNSKGIGEPNSTPVGSDLMFETNDAFIHIDLKTAQTRNITDINESIFIGNNQTSFKGTLNVRNSGELSYENANLPKYYKYKCGNNNIIKPCLTYFITILHDESNLKILTISIMCMPNGQLESDYKNKVLKAGKKVISKEREKKLVSTVRYNFSENSSFLHLENKKRIKVVYIDDAMQEEQTKRLKFLIGIYKNQT